MNLKHNEVFTCKRYRLYTYLIDKGFEPFLVLPDPFNSKYRVWQFKNTPELETALEYYFQNCLKGD